MLDGADPHLQHVFETFLQLALHMDGGGGDKGMDAKGFGDPQGFACGIDILGQGAGEGADPAVLDVTGYGLHRLKITGGRDREAHFHDVDTESFQRLGNLQLLLDRQAGRQRLLAITQGGIEYDDSI